MKIRFWGVRGSIAVSGTDFLRTGGNTSCIEIEHQGERLILDGGTGLRALGDSLGSPTHACLLFSHVHWDHIQGVPFFAPAFHPESQLVIGGAARPAGGVRDALAAQMRPPTFPITLDILKAQLSFQDLTEGEPWEYGPFRINSLELPHPDGVRGFRVEADGRSLVYATDVEHGTSLLKELIRFSEGVDLLIHDAQYTEDEYRGIGTFARKGWGHSAWTDAVNVAAQAQVGKLALFHHDPRRNDDAVAVIEAQAAARYRAFAAREGQPVQL
jgi:phosphoribosyl 1,2-cyclic phosphodiesterase